MPRYATVIHWFRRDLRLTDNTALHHAVAASEVVVPVYLQSTWQGSHAWTGPGRQAFLCGCLDSLAKNLEHIGGRLFFRRGDPVAQLEALVRETRPRRSISTAIPIPTGVRSRPRCANSAAATGSTATIIRTPSSTNPAGPHRLRPALQGLHALFEKLVHPDKDTTPARGEVDPRARDARSRSNAVLSDWGFPSPGIGLPETGEKAARARLKAAVEKVIGHYAERRDDPAADATSHLGPDLRYGTISVREVYHRAAEAQRHAANDRERKSIFTFQKQLAWREFFMAILHHFPEVLETDFNPDWRGLAWDDPDHGDRLQRWKDGRTGFPIVDAGCASSAKPGTCTTASA